MKIKEKKNKKAISLIVLVITIIVLSILAATVIISISNTNVIEEANKTVFKSDMSNYKEVFEMYITTETMKDNTFDSTTLDGTYKDNKDTFNKIFGKVESKYQDGITIQDGKLVYKTEDEAEKEILEALGIKSTDAISKTESFVGYFADVDGDGEVDGVITGDYCTSGDTSEFKDYVISQSSYYVEEAPGFGEHPVIKAKGGQEDKKVRFYVMALEDTGELNTSYTMYKNSFGVTKESTDMTGAGKNGTKNLVECWNSEKYGTQSDTDIWGVIQNTKYKYNYYNGWFVASPNTSFLISLGLTASNYSDSFNLSRSYWTR